MPGRPSNSWDTGGDPWSPPAGRDGAAPGGVTTLRGLSWDMVRDILDAPARSHRTILGLACMLVDEPGNTTTVQAAAMRLRTTEVAVLEAVSRLPAAFRLRSSGHRIALALPGQDPAEPSPRQLAELERQDASARRAQAKAARAEADDAAETPANRLRQALEALGLPRDDARGFARHLAKGYGEAASMEAIASTARTRPVDPKSWISAALRRRLEAPAQEPTRRVARLLPFVQPSGTRETRFVGWSAGEPRMKLYRLPEGRIKEEAPDPGERVPTLIEDPGCIVR